MGSVVASRRRPHEDLPNAISLPWIPEGPPDIRAGQFAGRLGVEHDPLYVLGNLKDPLQFQAPALVLEGNMTPGQLQQRRELLRQLDRSRRDLDQVAATRTWQRY